MKATTRLTTLLAALSISTAAGASEQLTQKYACMGCHQEATKTVGPSWKSIRDKYKGESASTAQLVQSIKGGSSGKWGPIPMPPQAAVPDADARAIAVWILNPR